MTISSDHVFSLTSSYKKTFQGEVFQNWSYVCKTRPKLFLKCNKRSGSDSSLLFLFRDGRGSAAIKFNKER